MLRKKSLGQHFLHNPYYLRLIVDAAHLKAGERVLEIGPGEGALTRELLKRDVNVIAIEKDARLIPMLQEKFRIEISTGALLLVESDALAFAISKLKLKKYIVVANIPYYITGALLKKFLSEKNQPSRMVLLVQKEVAERIARSTKESILSLSIKAYGTARYVKTVPRGAFSPVPSVDSAIMTVENISRKNFANAHHEKRFFEMVRGGFSHKRKLLKRNLERLLGKNYVSMLQIIGIPDTARAEDVSLGQWIALSREV